VEYQSLAHVATRHFTDLRKLEGAALATHDSISTSLETMPPIPHKQSKKAQRRAAAAVQSRPVNQSRPRVRVAQDSLRWNPVSTNGVMGGLDDTGGMMMLEELDGVDVEWETGVGGSKTARFMVSGELYGWLPGADCSVRLPRSRLAR
jgi:hypothetical protein